MRRINVTPLEKVGNITFGMGRDEVRNIINEPFTEFKKTKFSRNTTDDYGYCHVFYNSLNQCEAIEFFIDETVEIVVNNDFIISKEFSLLKKYITDMEEDHGVYISKANSMGISLTDGEIETVLFAEKNYY